ncbi:MAG: hypothetical protein HWD58_15945 [Bacteroidota bacterium]|nr:MAG: hypothetical protein HWD58_15945 [Bacteroidota bacterium]
MAGKFAATAQLIENKGLSIFADFNPHIQFKKNRHIILLIGQWEYLSALSNTVNHGGYAHLRYNYRLKPLLKWEVLANSNTTGSGICLGGIWQELVRG